jgi:hypothetical protein
VIDHDTIPLFSLDRRIPTHVTARTSHSPAYRPAHRHYANQRTSGALALAAAAFTTSATRFRATGRPFSPVKTSPSDPGSNLVRWAASTPVTTPPHRDRRHKGVL